MSQRVEVRLYVKLPKMWGMGKKEIFLPISFSSFYITVNFKHGRDILSCKIQQNTVSAFYFFLF